VRRARGRALTVAAALAWLLALPCAQADDGKEAAVRAAFLFRLAFFVSWPEGAFDAASSPVRICLAPGNDDLARTLAEQTATRTVQERPVAVAVLSTTALASEVTVAAVDSVPAGPAAEPSWADCHILYLGSAGAPATAGHGHTVTVVDSLGQLERAGALALVREESAGEARLVFYGRRDRLQGASFSLSSKLLQLLRFHEGRS
jgi:hypothetical protein